MAHTHSVYDTDTHFIIDAETREITTETGNALLIQHDHNSERFTFELPRYIDGHDMSLCNLVQVHYLNIDATTSEQYQGIYKVEDLQADTENEEIVTGSWLVSRNATQFVGALHFILRFACVADDGTIDYDWHTAIYRKLTVGLGINNTEVIAEQYADIVAQWESNIASKADETKVNDLNNTVNITTDYQNVTGELTAGFVNANTGIIGTGGNYQRTDYIPVSSNAVVYYSGRIFGWAGVAGFDKNKKYVTAILKNDDGVGRTYDKHILNIPDNVKYIIATTMAKSFGLEIITHKKIVDFKIEPDSNIVPNLNHFAVFKSFSAIGDSITEGLYPSTFNEDGSVKKWAANKSFSWVRYLGALTGASNYNYGVSGATAKTWYTNQYGYSMMVNNNKRTQAYIIGLGVNDVISADYPIGSVADVDFDDCSNNAETFIGCYAKIIQSVISLNPTAKIFCLIPPNISTSNAPKYDALKTLIADEHFVGTVFCVDLSSQDYKGFYQTDAVTKFKFGVHYSAPGYAQLAKILLYALSKTMIDNSQYFNQISEIVYDN